MRKDIRIKSNARIDKAILYNAISNGLVWIAACSLIGYAIKQTGRLSPLFALFLVPSFSVTTRSEHKDEPNNTEYEILDDEKEETKDGSNNSEEKSDEAGDGEVQE